MLNRIALKILMFNLLLVFLPIGSFFFLDVYEDQLLRSLEHALVQQGRVIAAALSDSSDLDREWVSGFLSRMAREHTARFRILDANGDLLADSAIIDTPHTDNNQVTSAFSLSSSSPYSQEWKSTRNSLMYQLASSPVRAFRRMFLPPVPATEAPIYPENLKYGPEVRAALEGKYGSSTRISSGGQISVTLYSAIPVIYEKTTTGVVLVSQSTFRILKDLYEIRLSLFRIFLYSLCAAGILTIISAITISFPLNKLREEALVGLAPTSRKEIRYSYTHRSDEIGDLARALTGLSAEVRDHVQYIESFASDISHEFRNPLASIRAAVDMARLAKSAPDRTRFLGIIESETESLRQLITGIRELSRLDMKDESIQKESICPEETARNVYSRLGCSQKLEIQIKGKTAHTIEIEEILLERVFSNLFSNSADFAPPDSVIHAVFDYGEDRDNSLVVRIRDEGPGFDEGSIDCVFDRFYSYRNASDTGNHSGLGLAIVKSIVQYWQGTLSARNLTNKEGEICGASIEVTIPEKRK